MILYVGLLPQDEFHIQLQSRLHIYKPKEIFILISDISLTVSIRIRRIILTGRDLGRSNLLLKAGSIPRRVRLLRALSCWIFDDLQGWRYHNIFGSLSPCLVILGGKYFSFYPFGTSIVLIFNHYLLFSHLPLRINKQLVSLLLITFS